MNVGDSRAIISKCNGQEFKSLTKDHKPEEEVEFGRVMKNGGELYKVGSNLRTQETKLYIAKNAHEYKQISEME